MAQVPLRSGLSSTFEILLADGFVQQPEIKELQLQSRLAVRHSGCLWFQASGAGLAFADFTVPRSRELGVEFLLAPRTKTSRMASAGQPIELCFHSQCLLERQAKARYRRRKSLQNDQWEALCQLSSAAVLRPAGLQGKSSATVRTLIGNAKAYPKDAPCAPWTGSVGHISVSGLLCRAQQNFLVKSLQTGLAVKGPVITVSTREFRSSRTARTWKLGLLL